MQRDGPDRRRRRQLAPASTDVATIAVTSPGRGHGRGRIDVERALQVDSVRAAARPASSGRCPRIRRGLRRGHRAPSLSKSRRIDPLSSDTRMPLSVVRHRADDQNRTAVIEAGIGDERGEVGRSPRRRLRATPQRRAPSDHDSSAHENRRVAFMRRARAAYITFFCACRASMPASARNSSTPATYPLVPSCRNGDQVADRLAVRAM